MGSENRFESGESGQFFCSTTSFKLPEFTKNDLARVIAGEKSLYQRSSSPRKTQELAGRLAQLIRGSPAKGEVLTLSGNLGSGKTTFVQGFCAALGVHEKITSPTFTLMHIYQGDTCPIYHFDFYRLNSTAEIAALGVEEYWEGEGISLIEWPELAWPLLPNHPLAVRFRMPDFVGEPETREIIIARNSTPSIG